MKSNAAVTATAIAALYQPAAAKVNCGGCEDIDAQRNIDCATVKVPLDYTSPNRTETLDLQLLRVQSKHKPSKGSILFNFGGPGLAGRDTLSTGYNVYMAYVPRTDIIAMRLMSKQYNWWPIRPGYFRPSVSSGSTRASLGSALTTGQWNREDYPY